MPAEHKQNSLDQRDILYKYESEGGTNYAMNGRRFAFLSNSLNVIEDDTEDLGILLCDFWNDIDFQNTQNEGGNSFPASKKPEKLIFRFLKMFTKEGDLVMDSFLGSGSTMVAAHQLKRKCYGMELDPKYCQVIIDRMKKLDPSIEVKINGQAYEPKEITE